MNNDYADDKQDQTQEELSPSSSNIDGNEKAASPKHPNNRAKKNTKWSLWKHWKAATHKQQLIWVARAIGATVSVAVAVGVYVLGHQPSITVTGIPVRVNQDGSMDFRVAVTNSTDNEATSFSGRCEFFLDGKSFAVYGAADISIPSKPTEIGGHATAVICGAGMPAADFKRVRDGESILVVYPHFIYSGLAMNHTYCNKSEYHNKVGEFVNIGTCDPTKPFPQ